MNLLEALRYGVYGFTVVVGFALAACIVMALFVLIVTVAKLIFGEDDSPNGEG